MLRFLVPLLLAMAHPLSAQIARDVQIPMRDGKTLSADLYAIDTVTPRPVILIQTPYNKNYYRLSTQLPPQAGGAGFPYDSVNYNYVVVDWRGFYGSRDAAVNGYDRGLDGYDAVEWIAAQRWSNSKVGTWGPSALGYIQFQTARHHPPHLVCAVPLVKDFKVKYTDYYYGGVYRREHAEALASLGFTPTALVLANPTNNITWTVAERATDYPDSIEVPMLMISGWYDIYPDDILRAFSDLQTRSHPSVRAQHKLVMGPWTHSAIGQLRQGALEYPEAVGVPDETALRFFDHYLRDAANGYPAEPAVRYFQMGSGEWRNASSWNELASNSDTVRLFLGPSGSLSRGIVRVDLRDTIVYDPRDPSPSTGGARLPLGGVAVGPQDQQAVESRGDALVFSTEPLAEPIEINGGVSLELFVSSDRTDSDIAVRLVDVHPDGRSMLVTQGIRRLRFRDGFRPADTSLIAPGTVYRVPVELQNIALTLSRGHQLRIIITSSNYPQFDLNPNTGGELYAPGDTLTASNVIHFGGTWPSSISFPTSPTSSGVDAAAEDRTAPALRMSTPHPHPISRNSVIPVMLDRAGRLVVTLHDLMGRTVAVLADRQLQRGEHAVAVDPGELLPGVYVVRAVVGGSTSEIVVLAE